MNPVPQRATHQGFVFITVLRARHRFDQFEYFPRPGFVKVTEFGNQFSQAVRAPARH
jgi:hypothetical protein